MPIASFLYQTAESHRKTTQSKSKCREGIKEVKWQQVGGSVDEKYPYLVLNIQMKYEVPTILILDGNGYKKGAEKWIRSQSGHGNFLSVFNLQQFHAWVNNGNL